MLDPPGTKKTEPHEEQTYRSAVKKLVHDLTTAGMPTRKVKSFQERRCMMISTSSISKLTTSKQSTRFRRVISVILRAAAWALLTLAALVTTLLVGWVLLGVVLLGSEPNAGGTPIPVILLTLLVLTGLLAWLTARYFASWRRVGQTIGIMMGLVVLVGMTWAVSAPNYALYFAREIAWAGNAAPDYARQMAQGGTYAHYSQNSPPTCSQ